MDIALFNIYRGKFLKEDDLLFIIEANPISESLEFEIKLKKRLRKYRKFFKNVSINFLSDTVFFESLHGHNIVAEKILRF
jgi:hypothetical protein